MNSQGTANAMESLQVVDGFPGVHCHHFLTEIDDQNLCKGLTADPLKNSLCVNKKCLSIWKACPACLDQDEVKRIGHRSEICCEPGKKLCEFHLTFGEKEKRRAVDVDAILAVQPMFQFPSSVVKKITALKKDVIAIKIVGEVVMVDRRRVLAFKDQPRKHFSKSKLQELANSIAEIGQRTPNEVRKLDGNPDFDWELIDGERRFLALGIAGINEMKTIVVNPKNAYEHFVSSVVANFCREGHTPLEVANAIRKIKDESGYSDEKIGKMYFGKSGVWVNAHLHLLDLNPVIQDMMDPNLPTREQLPATVAMFVASGEKNHEKQLILVKEIQDGGMKTGRALAHIRERIATDGGRLTLKGGVRKRRPSDEYKIFIDFLARTKASAKMHIDMGLEKIQEIFVNRPFDDRQRNIDDMNQIITDLQGMIKIINDLV